MQDCEAPTNSCASASARGDSKRLLNLFQLLGFEELGSTGSQAQLAGPTGHFGWVVPLAEEGDADETHLGGYQMKKEKMEKKKKKKKKKKEKKKKKKKKKKTKKKKKKKYPRDSH